MILCMGKSHKICCEVLLCQKQNQVKVKAIVDTGNRLRDTITGKPVSIISNQTAKILWKEIPIEGLRYVPYHTIEKKQGILPVLMLDEMYVYLEEELYVSKALVAICEETIGTGEYEMILNSDIR